MGRILSHFPTENLILHKLNNISYNVEGFVGKQNGKFTIMSEDISIPIEEEDFFERKLPNGIVEYFEVINSGYVKGISNFPDHYQTEVRKTKNPSFLCNTDNSFVVNDIDKIQQNDLQIDNETNFDKAINNDFKNENYVTEELIYFVLNYYREHPYAKPIEIGLNRNLYNNIMEIINDQGYAKGIKIKYINGDVYAVLINNFRLTLSGIKFLDNRKDEPKVYANEDEDSSNITVFLSYSWEDGDFADIIEKELMKEGLRVCRDIRDLCAWKSIKDYMNTIRDQDYVVALVSENYLHSENCMYEIGEILKDKDFMDKIFPAVISKDIYDINKHIEYIKYWEESNDKLEEQINKLSLSNRAALTDTFRRRKAIESNIDDFLKIVKDMNNPDIDNVCEVIIEKIKKHNNI